MKKFFLICLPFAIFFLIFFSSNKNDDFSKKEKVTFSKEVMFEIGEEIRKNSELPTIITDDSGKSFQIDYGLNETLNNYVDKTLLRYLSDYSSVVVIDNETGKIIALSGRRKKDKKRDLSLPLTVTHPAASLFKVVTSVALIEKGDVGPQSQFSYNGRGTTLYKYQLKDKKNKWTRNIDFKTAFALSNNVVFGKAALENLDSLGLNSVAYKFGFNKEILPYTFALRPYYQGPEDSYNLAEIASGMNDTTLTGPVHVASIASIIANEGILHSPYLVEKVYSSNSNEIVFQNEGEEKRVISEDIAKTVQNLMAQTIKRGTARKQFRNFKMLRKDLIRVGGKTGSITGGLPYGKRDWFMAYAIPHDEKKGKGISLCVMNINGKRWYYKSTFIAKKIIQYYFSEIQDIFSTNKNHEGVVTLLNKAPKTHSL